MDSKRSVNVFGAAMAQASHAYTLPHVLSAILLLPTLEPVRATGAGSIALGGAPEISGNLVSDNWAGGNGGIYGGGGVCSSDSDAIICNNTIVHNETLGFGGGVYGGTSKLSPKIIWL